MAITYSANKSAYAEKVYNKTYPSEKYGSHLLSLEQRISCMFNTAICTMDQGRIDFPRQLWPQSSGQFSTNTNTWFHSEANTMFPAGPAGYRVFFMEGELPTQEVLESLNDITVSAPNPSGEKYPWQAWHYDGVIEDIPIVENFSAALESRGLSVLGSFSVEHAAIQSTTHFDFELKKYDYQLMKARISDSAIFRKTGTIGWTLVVGWEAGTSVTYASEISFSTPVLWAIETSVEETSPIQIWEAAVTEGQKVKEPFKQWSFFIDWEQFPHLFDVSVQG